ncbi:PAS domain S-box protein [Paracoccus sp. p4-l81]|uniref:methyl-accepting chemotaxis protein n=1 Tax=Paracoccus sp. p4-l81 TaxID=3342806 RepID=UPI0035B84253
MFGKRRVGADLETAGLLQALDRAQAMIWFSPDGTVLEANQNFLDAIGYRRDEIVGRHHSMFVEPAYAASAEYRQFWERLRAGDLHRDTFPRIRKSGDVLWIEASYNPVIGPDGRVVKVVKFATDVTASKLAAADAQGKIAVLNQAQAMIEFTLDGIILTANDLFLKSTGYRLDEIVGQHHRIFMRPAEAKGAAYVTFWKALAQGEAQDGDFVRLTRDGHEITLRATYSPVRGPMGDLVKVVKIARDVTALRNQMADAAGQLAAISRAQAVIEFDMTGNILRANDNFCTALGYRADEIVGRHHSIFVRPDEVTSSSYHEFWAALGRGDFQAAEYLRIGKGGKEVWIQASYNPIFDPEGRAFKVVKYATDITAQKRAIQTIRTCISQLAEGDLTGRIDQSFPAEYEQVRHDLNGMTAHLGDVMMAVTDRAHQIQGQAEDIKSAAADLSRRTEQQAATLEETAAAIDEMTSSIKSASDGAAQASRVVETARQNADSSGAVVRQAVEAMGEIAEGSKRISSITSVIEEIAFQTNLLALNAGVEAARAGEAGRGFAVVASEVRALALRSSDAAREIAGLISESGDQVRRGVDLVNQAGAALDSIQTSVREIHLRVTDIATSSQEQAAGLAEINIAVNHLDQVTQQNAAMTAQTNDATAGLSEVADRLAQDMSQFQLPAMSPGARNSNGDNTHWAA